MVILVHNVISTTLCNTLFEIHSIITLYTNVIIAKCILPVFLVTKASERNEMLKASRCISLWNVC